MSTDRRRFLASCAAASAALAPLSLSGQDNQPGTTADDHPLIIFAKPLQHLSFGELGKRLKSIGVQGIEATLRKGGQIEPEQLPQRLGELVESLAEHDQRVIIAASDINSVSEATERQVKQFAKYKIPYFRMSYYRYDFEQPLLPQLDEFATQAAELAEMCAAHGVTALYQNHAGQAYVGAALWDLQRVLKDVDPAHLAVALDVRHTALELGMSWRAGYSIIRPHVGAIYVKDFAWIDNRAENVPLAGGVSRPVFNQVKRDGLIGPISLHVEYIDHRGAELQEQRWEAVTNDVATLRDWLS